jgi:hypothetical protein
LRTARHTVRWLVRLALLGVVLWAARSAANVISLAPQPTSRWAPRTPAGSATPAVRPQPPAGSCHARGSGPFALPDPRCTPGAINPPVARRNIATTTCRKGWTAGVRAPERVTEAEKRASMAAYGDAGPLRRFKYDHLVPLELGGAVDDPRNLWPERGASPNPKDELENRLNDLVCRRHMPLRDAQRLIATNWVNAYRRFLSPGAAR